MTAKASGHMKVLAAQQSFVFAFAWGLGGDLPVDSSLKIQPFCEGPV